MQSTLRWAQEEFGAAEMGDARRTRRLVSLASEVSARPAGTVTGACVSSASREGAFRLLENPAVRSTEIRRCVVQATSRLCQGRAVVFVPIDATSLRITDTKRSKGIGCVGTWAKGARGVQVMSALSVGDDGQPLGILAQQMWIRSAPSRRDKKARQPTSGGENVVWQSVIDDCRRGLAATAPETTPWYQIDRGGDCWQVLSYADEANLLITVRAVHDRRLDARAARLWSVVEKAPVLATRHVAVPARGRKWVARVGTCSRTELLEARPARQAKVTIRAVKVPVLLSTPNEKLAVEFNAVLVQESGRFSDRVEWLLLTTHCIDTRADVLEVVRGYSLRWRIEDFHRAWKSGLCRVEQTQLRSREAIYKWATLLATVATRAMKLTHQARLTPDLPATTELTPVEIEAIIALRRPKGVIAPVPTLGQAVRWLADLGGYTGRSNGPPGATVIGRGLYDVLVAARAFEYRKKM